MPYNSSALRGSYQTGDPFLGGLAKGVLGVAGSILPGPLGAGARLIKGAVFPGGAPSGVPMRRPRRQQRRGRRFGTGGLGSVGIPPEVADKMREMGGEKKRRRMNYQNQKAARRAIRRLTGMARQNKALKKAASEFAREFGPQRRPARRDLGRGHTHVR